MDIFIYPGALIIVLVALLYFTKFKAKANKKKIPELYIGAIRVTDHQGRDMLIVRKEDGSFEMVEEAKVRK